MEQYIYCSRSSVSLAGPIVTDFPIATYEKLRDPALNSLVTGTEQSLNQRRTLGGGGAMGATVPPRSQEKKIEFRIKLLLCPFKLGL